MTDSRKNYSRCEFLFADGRRCRMPSVDPSLSLCLRHLQLREQKEEAARIGDEIVGADGALNTQEGIHKALANVFANLARNRISARNAAVLGYVGQLMLVSRPSIERTIQSLLPALQLAIKIGHQNSQSQIKSDVALRKNALLEQEIITNFMAQFEAFRELSPEDLLRMMKFASMFTGKPFPNPGAKPPATPSAGPKPSETPSTKPQAATNSDLPAKESA